MHNLSENRSDVHPLIQMQLSTTRGVQHLKQVLDSAVMRCGAVAVNSNEISANGHEPDLAQSSSYKT